MRLPFSNAFLIACMSLKRIKLFLLIVFCSAASYTLQSQELSDLSEVPSVFRLGNHSAAYETLLSGCNNSLLENAGESLDEAYIYWLNLLQSIEEYAKDGNFDIRGVKLWLNIFWDSRGRIMHICYYPKHDSRNIDFDRFEKMLTEFVSEEHPGISSNSCFNHSGTAQFPSHADFLLRKP